MGSGQVFQWRKSSSSGGTGDCVEVTPQAVRDSKNPEGPTLRVDLRSLVTFAKNRR